MRAGVRPEISTCVKPLNIIVNVWEVVRAALVCFVVPHLWMTLWFWFPDFPIVWCPCSMPMHWSMLSIPEGMMCIKLLEFLTKVAEP